MGDPANAILLLCCLLVTAPAKSAETPASPYGTPRSVEDFRAVSGDVKIDSAPPDHNYGVRSSVYLGITTILTLEDRVYLHSFFSNDNILILNEFGGGNICAGKYWVLKLLHHGRHLLSEPIGNCSAPIVTSGPSVFTILFPKGTQVPAQRYDIDSTGKVKGPRSCGVTAEESIRCPSMDHP